jgi:hypothetical protein
VGLERGPLSLVSTTEELFGRKSTGSGLENRDSSGEEGRPAPKADSLSAVCKSTV